MLWRLRNKIKSIIKNILNKLKKRREGLDRFLYGLEIIILILEGGVDMAVIYATLIVRGARTYAEVPQTLKKQVKQVLIDLEMEELVIE